jgi:hypothetical protein
MSGVPMLSRALASLTRRRFLLGAGAVAGTGAAVAAGVAIDRAVETGSPVAAGTPGAAPVPSVPLGTQPAGLPARQHAWNAVLARDQYGNPISPLYHRLLFFDVNGHPSAARARVLEAALRTLERAYPWAPAGLLFTAGWGQPYFADVLRVASPIPVATAPVPRCPARTARSTCRARCGGARRGPGSSARACPRSARTPAGFRQAIPFRPPHRCLWGSSPA